MSATPRRPFRAAVTVVALATAALLGTAGTALACWTDDNRATPIEGNTSTCEKAKLPGTEVSTKDLTYTGGTNDDKYLNITAVAAGVKVTAIVVKGGDGYNVYEPGKRGLGKTPPWEKLRSPMNKGGQQATISHWFACGEKTKPTEPTKPSEPTRPTKPSSSAPATSKPAESSPAPTSTPAPAPAIGGDGSNGGGLADTGFDNAWLLWAGGLLVLAGAGVLVLLRVRRKAS